MTLMIRTTTTTTTTTVRDLGGHLDFTLRARAGTLSKRVGEATVGVASVGALPLGFQVKLGPVRGKYLPAGLHAAEASYVSSSSISSFRAAIVRAVWSFLMPLANTPAILAQTQVVCIGQPMLIACDLNADPAVIPSLSKGISAGRFVDLALAYSLGSGSAPDATCRFSREEGTG